MGIGTNIFIETIKKIFSNEKRITAYKLAGLLSIALSIIIIMLYTLQSNQTLFEYLSSNTVYFFYFPILFIIFFEIKLLTPNQDKKLSDIDDNTDRIINIVNNNGNVNIESNKSNKLTPHKASSDFSSYFTSVINYLEIKSIDSDKKASLLLDNGKRFSALGILFFIVATIAWQFYISYIGKFETQHIYGIVSTSLVFIFIEFLSAWYLRQYKSFSDTATYLTKIKSIFDKYMLIYLVSVEKGDKDFSILLKQLSSEIKWPETYLLKNADVNFAKEALETLTTMAQAFKNEVKNKEAS